MDNSTLYRHIIPDTSGLPLAPRIITSSEITPQSVKNALQVWQSYESRFDALFYRYVGLGSTATYFNQMKDGTWKIENPTDVRTLANFSHYIVKSIKGYIIGNAPEYEYGEGDVYGEAIADYFHQIEMERVDADLIQDMSTYGVAYELIYRDEDGQLMSETISPRDCFVAYTGDVAGKPVFGCIRYGEPRDDNTIKYTLKVYTDTEILTYESDNEDTGFIQTGSEYHGMGRVPILCYPNNKERMSDIEQTLALESAYNHLLIDRLADKDAFVKAILVITGSVIGMTADELKEARKNLNDLRVLQMDNDGSTAQFLEHQLNEADVDVLQSLFKDLLHKFSGCPDMSDENFANNSSGVAMAYKMLGQDEAIADKESAFRKVFKQRCRIYDWAMNNPSQSPSYEPRADIGGMNIVFKHNVPQDLSYMSTALTQLTGAGIMSKDTARQVLTVIADADAEKEKVDSEAEQDVERNRASFEDDYSTTPQNMDENPNITEDETVQ